MEFERDEGWDEVYLALCLDSLTLSPGKQTNGKQHMLSSRQCRRTARRTLHPTLAMIYLLVLFLIAPSLVAQAETVAAEIYGEIILPDGHKIVSTEINGFLFKNGNSIGDCRSLGFTDNSGTYALNLTPGVYLFELNNAYFVKVKVPATGGRQPLYVKERENMSLPPNIPSCTKP